MVTFNDAKTNRYQRQIMDIYGLSTDTKPDDEAIQNGSTFYEMDTQKVFMFDEENKRWIEQ